MGRMGLVGYPGCSGGGSESRPPAPTARGRGRLAQCEPGATQSTPPRAMRAQGDEIHPRSIRASPPRTMRPEVTSPKRLPITRGVPPARCWHCLVGPHHTWGRPYPGRSTRCRQGRPSPRLGGDVVVRATSTAGNAPWESPPRRRARPAGLRLLRSFPFTTPLDPSLYEKRGRSREAYSAGVCAHFWETIL